MVERKQRKPPTASPKPARPKPKTPSTPTHTAAPKSPGRAATPRSRKITPAEGLVPAASRTRRAKASEKPLRILMVTPEAHPFAKTGGLAEVAAALPAALVRLGHSVTLVLPRYRGVRPDARPARTVDLKFGPRSVRVGFVEEALPNGVRAVLVDVPELFERVGIYGVDGRDFPDNFFRFAVLSRAALEYARLQGERLSVIHTHDWQAGLVPVYQKMQLAADPFVGGVPAVFTIHNLAFQGNFPADTLAAVGLGWDVFHHEAMEHWGSISFLKGGVNFSDKITTVSPTYAREILTTEFGFGFEGVLSRRASDLVGILNGIDTDRWNPASDPFVPPYSADNMAGKREAKRALLRESRLPSDEASLSRPVVGLISRLTHQKGLDLIGQSVEKLMAMDAAWVLLGSGERQYEELWRAMATRHPDRVSATIGFDERLAHLIEAGADMFLMPSHFEPCGLNQLYSLRYGTVPIVRATGGLQDTVIDAVEDDGNGIKFAEPTPEALVGAVRRALDLYRVPERWGALQRAGMAGDRSWDVSAREYVKVYRELERRD